MFVWIDKHVSAQGLLPSGPSTGPLAYLPEGRAGLEVYLHDPEVPIDTNHLERALRVILMGRTRYQTPRYRARPASHLPFIRHQSVRLFHRRATARGAITLLADWFLMDDAFGIANSFFGPSPNLFFSGRWFAAICCQVGCRILLALCQPRP